MVSVEQGGSVGVGLFAVVGAVVVGDSADVGCDDVG